MPSTRPKLDLEPPSIRPKSEFEAPSPRPKLDLEPVLTTKPKTQHGERVDKPADAGMYAKHHPNNPNPQDLRDLLF